MERDPHAKELASLKQALPNFEHRLDAFEARMRQQSKEPEVRCLAATDPQIAFANEVVAAMKNRLSEDRAMAGMRRGELS